MTPILYEKDEIDFTSQGLGALAEIYDVDVAEQRNGLFQLTANYPVTGIRYDDISVGRIILAKPNQRDEPHAFRIVNTELDVMGYSLMIEADSITYDLNHNFIKHLTVNDATGQAMMSAIQSAIVNPSIFTFYSDINHKSSTKLDYVNPMEAVMGVQGSFLQYWGGELKRENRRVAMFNRRGRDNVATFRLGKNVSGLKYKVDISSLVTRIVPVKSVQENDKTTYLEGTPVSSKYINNYEQIYTIKVDFTDESIKTVDDLNKAAEGWFVDSANTGRDKPSVTIDIDVLSLQDSADYQDKFKNLESVALTDTVTVYVPEYGVNVTAIVNEIHFDPIQERVTKLTVGTAKMSFADSSRVQLSDLQGKIISVQEQADQIAVSANGKNSNYYGSVEPSHPQEGDLWYWVNGDLSGIKQFVNGEWVDLVDSNTQQQIADSVNQAVSDAQKYSDKLVADNAEQVNRVLSDVQDKQVELKNEQAELDRKAQGYANKALEDAKSDTQEAVSQAVGDAQQALDALRVGGRNYVLNSSGLNSSTTVRPALSGAVSGANVLVTYPADGILMTNGATNKTTEWYYQVANAWTNFSSTPLTAGNTFSFSADVMGTAPQAILRWGFNGAGGYESFKAFNINNTGWTRVSVTLSSNATNTGLYFRIQGGINNQYQTGWAGGETLKFRNVKIEDGNMPTSWTPAPEDVVLDYTNKDNTIKKSLTQYQKYNDERVTQAKSEVAQAVGEVSTKVSQTTFDQKTGQIEGDISTFRQTATEISKTVANVKGQVDGLQLGGRNYILNSSGLSASASVKPSIPDSTNSTYNSAVEYQSDGIQLTVVATNREWYYAVIEAYGQLSKLTQFVPGMTYTLSVDAKGTAPGIAFRVNNAWSEHHPINDISWTRFSYTFTLPENATTIYVRINASNGTPGVQNFTAGQTIKLRNFKLEDGNMPTSWTPAPEDAESKIATQKITIDGITEAVSKHTSDINSVTSRVTTAEGTITTTKNKVDDLESTQTQTAKQITSEVNDRKNGDTNTLTQANKFTTSSINSSAEGLRSEIAQTGDAILARVESTNMVVNSEFDPLDGTWYQIGTGAPVGTKLGAAWKVSPSGSFVDWPVVNGSRVVSYSTGNWYSSKLMAASAGKAYSASIIAGRVSATASTGLDFRIAFWDANGALISNVSSGNIIEGSSYKGIQKYVVENKVAPANTRYVSVVIAHSSGNASDVISRPSLNTGEKASPYTPTYGTNASSTILSLFKDNWSIGIADNAGKLASGVFGDINGMTLNGKTVTINANQTVITGTAFITDAMISTMSASKLTAGTIDASNINVTNINANNIVSGAISGANLNINLNTGQVVFQRGRIYNPSVDETGWGQGGIDVNIDKRYLASSNGESVSMLSNGRLSLIERTLFTGTDSTPYFEISNSGDTFDWKGAALTGKEKVVLTTKGDTGGLYYDGRYLNGLIIDKKSPAQLGGLTNGVIVSGGQGYSDLHNIFGLAPRVLVGVDDGGKSTAEIHMYSSWIRASAIEERTTSSGANVNVASDGTLVRSSSSSKYKLDIEYEQQADTANKLLTLDPATWHDKFESEQLDKFHEIGVDPERAIDMSNRRYYGIIAEDLVKAGLEHLVSRNVKTGEVEGVEYSKIGVALIPIIRELRNRLNEQYVEIERLKEQLQ